MSGRVNEESPRFSVLDVCTSTSPAAGARRHESALINDRASVGRRAELDVAAESSSLRRLLGGDYIESGPAEMRIDEEHGAAEFEMSLWF